MSERDAASDEGFRDFYEREYAGQLRRAYLLLGDEAEAHDAVAHAFTAVFERWGGLGSPGAYLNRVVLNACRDAGRRRARLRVVAQLDQPDRYDAHAELNDALLRLPFKQRAVVVLKHYARLTEAEIADHLGIAAGSVGPTLHRAHERLRAALEESP